MMIATRVIEPQQEPVSLEDVKLHLRLDPDMTAEDGLLLLLLQSAREEAEEFVRGSFMPQTWEAVFDRFPTCQEIDLPRCPLVAVESIKYLDADGVQQTLSPDVYQLDIPGRRVLLKPGQSWPATLAGYNVVTVRYTAGYANQAAIPARVKAALLLMVAEGYEFRQSIVTGTIVATLPRTAENLLWPLRDLRF